MILRTLGSVPQNLDAPAEVQVVSATTGSSYVSVFKSVRTQLFVCMTKAYTTYVGGNRMA